MNRQGTVTKTEKILLGMTAVFLCLLLAVFLRDQRAARGTVTVETARTAASEEILPVPVLVDLNSAPAEELETLPGIGAELARRIVAYRTENGLCGRVEELLEVSGIGEGKLEALKDRVCVDGGRTE